MYLADNKLTEISGAIWNGSHEISDLWLWGNELTTVRKDTFLGFARLGKISLEFSSITNIEAEAFSGTSARILILDANDLSDLREDMWYGMNSLETLSLDFNELTELRAGMWSEELVTLKLLSVSHNKITRIEPDTFKHLQRLGSLDLEGNLLTEIGPATWNGISRLVYLHLGDNQIAHLPDNSIPGLEVSRSTLNLENNNLTTLSIGIFNPDDYKDTGGHPQNLYLYLRGNPMNCDSRMCWIQKEKQDGWIKNSWASQECVNYPDVEFMEIDLDCEENGGSRETEG